jgi:hypothetical protein
MPPEALDDALNDVDDVSPSTPTPANSANKNTELKMRCRCVREPGLFSFLRDACMTTNRTLAQSNLAGYVYDNINLMNRIAEAILGRKSMLPPRIYSQCKLTF